MIDSRFRLRRGEKREPWTRAVGRAFSKSKYGLAWFASVGAFEAISAWTNVHGLATVLAWPAAIVLGVAIQAAIVSAGLHLISAPEEARPWFKRLLALTVCVSIGFSYLGFASNYLADQERRAAPLRARDDLKQQALQLSSAIDEARRTTGSVYSNRIDYAESVISRVRRREALGEYATEGEGEATIAQWQSDAQRARDAQGQWAAFRFDPSQALSATDVSAGFKTLQDAHTELGRLMGLLRKDEAKDFQMPPPPMPTPNLMDSTEAKTELQLAIALLLTIPGWGWFGLATVLELVPLWFANASAAHRDAVNGAPLTPEVAHTMEEATDEEASEPTGGTIPAFLGGGTMPAMAHAQARHDSSVQPRGQFDREMAEDITRFHELLRCASQAGAFTDAELQEQERTLEEARRNYQKAVVLATRNTALKKRVQEELNQLRTFVDALDQTTSDRRLEQEAIRECLRRIAVECEYEEVVRMIAQREPAAAGEFRASEAGV